MPLGDRLIGIALELLVPGICANAHPGSLGVEQQVRALRGHGKRGVDGRRDRVYELRPARIPQPERAAADAAEVPLPRALVGLLLARTPQLGPVDPEVFAALDGEGLVGAADVDRETAAARRLAADRAVAEVEGIGVRGLEPKTNSPALIWLIKASWAAGLLTPEFEALITFGYSERYIFSTSKDSGMTKLAIVSA